MMPLKFGSCLLLFFICGVTAFSQYKPAKINGVSFVASGDPALQSHIDPVIALHANYAAVMPFGFIRSPDQPEIRYNTSRQWFGETKEGTKQYIEILRKNGIRTMLKPQIWISHGEFTGALILSSEADWKIFEASYRNFILEFARVAQEEDVDLFCIGTELEQFVLHRPAFWKSLIAEVRTIYKGRLTYAANWDEYKRFPLWKELDFIGIDAYFPVSDAKTPTVLEARNGWCYWLDEIQSMSIKEKRKVIFTEFGYRSVDFAGKEPWKSDRSMTAVNLEAQNNTTQALFDELWNHEWFEGGFLWKWFLDHGRVGGWEDTQFTPQNKPVEDIIRIHYKTMGSK
jgi:hypothetical protein